MRSVEVSAATREEAIKMALEKLGAERHEVDVEILDEGSRGLFGFGARPVRLRVTDETPRHEPSAQKPRRGRRTEDETSAAADAPEKTTARGEREDGGERGERRTRGRRGGRRNRSGDDRDRSEKPEKQAAAETESSEEPKSDRAERSGRGRTRGRRGGRNRGERAERAENSSREDTKPAMGETAETTQVEHDMAPESGEDSGGRGRRRRRGGATRREAAQRREARLRESTRAREEQQAPRDGDQSSTSDAPREDRAPRGGNRSRREGRDESRRERGEGRGRSRDRDYQQAEPRAPRPAPEPSEPISEERALEAAALLTEIIEQMGMQATVTHELQEDGGCLLRVATEDSALLIGRKAQTLLALQYLVNRVIRQHEEENLQLIMVDIEGYIERRRDELTELAVRMAERAKEDGRRVRLKPLTPQERRIVHVALQEDDEVRTFSVGDGMMRSIVIAPKDEEAPAPRRERRANGSAAHQDTDSEASADTSDADAPDAPAEETADPNDETMAPVSATDENREAATGDEDTTRRDGD